MTNKKTRVQVSLSDDVIKAIDQFCSMTGMSRSSYCSFVISQSLMTTKQFMDNVSSGLIDSAADDEKGEKK